VQSGRENLQHHPKSPDGAAPGAVPVVAGAESTTTQSQPVTAISTQPSSITIIPPSGTLVPSGFVFLETSYEPHQDVTPEEVASLSDNDLLTGLKKQRKRTQEELDERHAEFTFRELEELTSSASALTERRKPNVK
jgi:hypothetical protein